MTRRHKQDLARILVAGVLLIGAVLTPEAWGLWRLPIFFLNSSARRAEERLLLVLLHISLHF